MSGHDVFISYKAEDYEAASFVRSELEANGLSCWMAPESLPGGSSYAKEIPKAIRGCRVLVAVLSRKTMGSIWVPKELDQALNAGKRIIPLMLEDFQLESDFDFYLTAVQRYPFYKNKNKAITDLINDIKGHHDPVAPKPRKDRRLKVLLFGLLALLLVMAAAFGVYRYFKERGMDSTPAIADPVRSSDDSDTGPIPAGATPMGYHEIVQPLRPDPGGSETEAADKSEAEADSSGSLNKPFIPGGSVFP